MLFCILDQRCIKHCKTSVFGSKAKKHSKLQHFWQVDHQNTQFWNVKKTWKARSTVNSGVLATFGRWNTGIYAIFLPVTVPPPSKLQHFFALFEPFFCLDECKKRWYLRVFQKIEDREVSETLWITVFYPLSGTKTVVFTRVLAIWQRKMLQITALCALFMFNF